MLGVMDLLGISVYTEGVYLSEGEGRSLYTASIYLIDGRDTLVYTLRS